MSSVPELVSLVRSLCDICLAGAFVGCVLVLMQCIFTVSFRLTRPSRPAPQPAVTILKPLHGVEPDLQDRLGGFCRQEYDSPVQLLCGTQDSSVPAAPTVRALQRQYPDKAIELNVEPRSHGANRKVSNLMNMLPRARHDILVLSDSDIVVGSTYLRDIAALLAQPEVGAVTCLYHGIGGNGPWSRLAALAINSQFLPQALSAIGLKLTKPCFGATIALRRSTLERIGGLGRFADELADDYAIGMAVRAAGYDVRTAPFLVGHCCFEDSLREHLLHQLRVARTVKRIDPLGYAGTILTHPWPLALLGMLSGSGTAALLALIVLISRITLCRCVEWRFGLSRQNYWLVPVQDIIAFTVYVVSFFGATVHWRGSEYRVAADGTLIKT